MENKILKRFEVTDVEIKMINGVPMFEIYSVGMAIGYVTKSKGKEYPHKTRIEKVLKNAEITTVVHDVQHYINENQLYDFLLEAHTDKCKTFRKWIVEDVLPTINNTGAYIEEERVPEVVENYLSELSEETKILVMKELRESVAKYKKENEELKEFYNTLMSTEGLLPMNTVAKELGVGLKRLYAFLRNNDVMFYKANVNIPYQRFMEQGLFKVKETPCHDGEYRPVTYATTKGLEYIRKLLVKKNCITVTE